MAYNRERWSSQLNLNSSFASNSNSNLTTRNQVDLNTLRLLRWNNWFYAGTASFLQSSVQDINLQTTLGGGIGRYLKNTNRTSIYVLGGFGWQSVGYGQNRVIWEPRTPQLVSSPARSKPSNSKRQTWMSRPLCFRRSRMLDVFITTPMRSTTSKSSRISPGTFPSTEAGTVALP